MGDNIHYTVKAEVPKGKSNILALLMSKNFTVFEYNKWENTYTPIETIPISPNNDESHYYVCIYNSHTPPAPYIMKKLEEEKTISYTTERRVEVESQQ